MSRKQSEKLFRQAQKHIPGGVNSPVRAFKGVGGTPVGEHGARALEREATAPDHHAAFQRARLGTRAHSS